jgi:hypothetical protein
MRKGASGGYIKARKYKVINFTDFFYLLILLKVIIYYYYYYYYYILHLSAKRYEELLAIRLGKPFMNKNLRHPSFAPFLCSPLLIYNS